MPTRDPQFDRKLAAIFRAEAAEHVQRMQDCLAQLDGGTAAGGQPIEQLFRATHSLKGAARAVGERDLEAICHGAEGVLAALQRGRLAWPAAGEALHDVVALLELGLRQPAPAADLAALLPRLQKLEREAQDPAAAAPPAPAVQAAAATQVPQPQPQPQPQPRPQPQAAPAAPADSAAEPQHTVRIGVERLDRLLFGVEELVTSKLNVVYRNAQLQDALASAAMLRAAALAAGGDLALGWQQHEQHLRLLAVTAERDTRQFAGAVDTLLADVKKALLLQAGTLRPILAAAVRELARSQGKDVELRLHGAEVEMDRRLLDDLREPLLHLVRNAIAHGIEPPGQRVAAGKPPRALLEVDIAPRSRGLVEITVSDDGAGIDTARLAAASRALGLPVPADAGPEELLPLVFGPGVSTAASLTEVAGRGIGLVIVRDTVERLGGAVHVRSQPGQGTSFTIALTLSLATYRTIEVHVAGRSFLLPAARVDRCLRFTAAQLGNVGGHPTLALGEEELPLISLAAVLELPANSAPPPVGHCLVVGDGPRRIALAVDAICGEQEVLGKPVETALTRSPVLSGVALLGAGQLAPVLNVPEVVRIAQRGGRRFAPAAGVAARPRGSAVLLAEDSITSRTLLKNILELAGHRVEVAVDGADALRKLRAGHFDVVVSDVEMPNLDGIALTEAIRGDPGLAELPVVLVTSLASPRDRERGAEAGANAYIVKSSFDQGDLLQALAELA